MKINFCTKIPNTFDFKVKNQKKNGYVFLGLFTWNHPITTVTTATVTTVTITRETMFCTTLKLKEVLNKQILSASVPDAAVLNSQSLE